MNPYPNCIGLTFQNRKSLPQNWPRAVNIDPAKGFPQAPFDRPLGWPQVGECCGHLCLIQEWFCKGFVLWTCTFYCCWYSLWRNLFLDTIYLISDPKFIRVNFAFLWKNWVTRAMHTRKNFVFDVFGNWNIVYSNQNYIRWHGNSFSGI